MKGVFQTKVSPSYSDIPERWYHFPHPYLGKVEQTVGDWIVYYEPRRSNSDDRSRDGRSSYFALARVTGIRKDNDNDRHYFADVADYLPFDRPVPFRVEGYYFESSMGKTDGKLNAGSAQRAVRTMLDSEYNNILAAGFLDEAPWPDRSESSAQNGFQDNEQAPFERQMVLQTTFKPFRDAAFRRQVQSAYDRRCAFTGLRILNGGGRPEVDAAHIQPVSMNGPDSVRNGLALSGTVHWMFDRGLIGLTNDFSIVTSRHLNSDVAHLLNRDMKALVPEDVRLRPHTAFLDFHRQHIFKH